jgi:predicted nucleotidyltransferase
VAESVVGVALYGSRARGDHRADSDVDVLAVTTDDAPATIDRGPIAVTSFPLDQLLRVARAGDLFALHIVSESKVIYQAWPVFDEIRQAFTYRSDYSREVRLASDVGWFLTRYHHLLRSAAPLNWRMAWCTRIILTARAADQRRPLFSATALAAFSGLPDVEPVIRNRASCHIDSRMIDRFRTILRSAGAPPPPRLATLQFEKDRFEADRNRAGVCAARALMK